MSASVIAFAVFFLSGFAALLYQVVWQRLLVVFSGADVYSVTVIVAAFMAGLGIGNLAGGQIADRFSPRTNLWIFAAAELAIAVFAAASDWLLYDVLYLRLSSLASSGFAGLIVFLCLLWPTCFMGMSLPLLARALTRHLPEAGSVIGALYGVNTLGAAAGALLTTWVLLPRLGLAGALPFGVAFNVACAVAGVLLTRVVSGDRFAGDGEARQPAPAAAVAGAMPFAAWAVLYGIAGFAALSLEIVWFRMLGVLLKSTAFTFGTVLAIYLLGIGSGAAIGSRLVRHSARPGRTFLGVQAALLLAAGAITAAVLALIEGGQPTDLVTHLGRNDYDIAAAPRSELLALFVALPAVCLGLPTFLMGLSFPFLQKAAQADLSHLGRRVATLMTANIAGSTLGAVLTGLVLLPWLSTAATLAGLVGLAAIPGLLWARTASGPRRLPAMAGVLAAVVIVGVALPEKTGFWATLHAAEARRVIVEEDGAGVTLLNVRGGQTLVFVNGVSQSWIPFGNIHTVLGALPLVMHASPADVAIIGLGSGDTAFAAGGRAETGRIACIEIIGGQRIALERLVQTLGDPGLVGLLGDRRIEHVVGDGRAYLLQREQRYDIIEADALRPQTAYSGNLYSREYFELVRSRLKTGGLAVTWAPTPRVRDTFAAVFPHVVVLKDVLVGSMEPLAFDRAAVEQRLHDPAFLGYYNRVGIDIRSLLAPYLGATPRIYGPETARETRELNSDLWPRDEFAAAR